jgi:glycosyltransferase involved in cell wall biosynthesis
MILNFNSTKIRQFSKTKPIYLILTNVSYPFGGGESFMYQTISWAKEFEVVWLSFCNSFFVSPQNEEKYVKDGCLFIKPAGGFSIKKLKDYIISINPDVIHTQGIMNNLSKQIIKELRIPHIIGYHFWFGLLKPSPNGGFNNIDMLSQQNIIDHPIDEFYINNMNESHIFQYTVSDFMNEVLKARGGPLIDHILYASSPLKIEKNDKRKYVTLININQLKGGDIFLKIVEALNLPFIGVCTEKNSDSLDSDIEKALYRKKGLFYHYTDITEIYKKTKILLLPGYVDETFCRVAYEGALNGIPIITQGKGFIKQMLGDSCILLGSNPSEWIQTVSKLYNDTDKLEDMSIKGKQQVLKYSNNSEVFSQILETSHLKSKKRNIMIFCPWCDQGLGIQSRCYSKILRSVGYRVHIFSFLPFMTLGKMNNFQKDPNEWNEYDTIYYSYNTRLNVTTEELLHFIESRHIGKFIIPEICYPPIYPIINFVRSLGVKCYGIPNIETIRKDELNLWKCFDKILFNTRICEEILKPLISCPSSFIGHYCESLEVSKNVQPDIKFCHISGYNSVTRKQTLKVCQAFTEALKYRDDISLTITFSTIPPIEFLNFQSNKIKFEIRDISHNEIKEIYKQNDVSIQVGSHEGLGLGFYESISCRTPVITMNCAPHNEIINDTNGFLMECDPFVLTDNNEALVPGYSFNLHSFVELLLNIKKEQILSKFWGCENTIVKFSIENFTIKFIENLY